MSGVSLFLDLNHIPFEDLEGSGECPPSLSAAPLLGFTAASQPGAALAPPWYTTTEQVLRPPAMLPARDEAASREQADGLERDVTAWMDPSWWDHLLNITGTSIAAENDGGAQGNAAAIAAPPRVTEAAPEQSAAGSVLNWGEPPTAAQGSVAAVSEYAPFRSLLTQDPGLSLGLPQRPPKRARGAAHDVAAPRPAEEAPSGYLCIICEEEEANMACLPCGHVCGCKGCMEKVRRKKMPCPVCNKKIQRLHRLYFCNPRHLGS